MFALESGKSYRYKLLFAVDRKNRRMRRESCVICMALACHRGANRRETGKKIL